MSQKYLLWAIIQTVKTSTCSFRLYNSRIVKLINKKHQLKSSVIIDELPTIYFRGLDNLIATARSNKVAVCLGFQDFSSPENYGDKESKVIQNTVGNVQWAGCRRNSQDPLGAFQKSYNSDNP